VKPDRDDVKENLPDTALPCLQTKKSKACRSARGQSSSHTIHLAKVWAKPQHQSSLCADHVEYVPLPLLSAAHSTPPTSHVLVIAAVVSLISHIRHRGRSWERSEKHVDMYTSFIATRATARCNESLRPGFFPASQPPCGSS
jgi:hypothetical protein